MHILKDLIEIEFSDSLSSFWSNPVAICLSFPRLSAVSCGEIDSLETDEKENRLKEESPFGRTLSFIRKMTSGKHKVGGTWGGGSTQSSGVVQEPVVVWWWRRRAAKAGGRAETRSEFRQRSGLLMVIQSDRSALDI